MAKWYREGTVTVTNGSPTVTGLGSAWVLQAKQGDTFYGPDGREYEIAEDPTTNTTLTLQTNYRGTSLATQPYAIKRYSDGWSVVASLALRIANFLQSVVAILSGTDVPSNSLGADGSIYFRKTIAGTIAVFFKSSGSWDAGTSLIGPAGPPGPGFSTSSTTSRTVGTGTQTFNIPGDGLSYLGSRMRAAYRSDTAKYMEGIVNAATATSVTINVDRTGGAGTFTDWVLVVAGDTGSQGPIGAASTGVSATSNTIGTGLKTWAVPTGLDLIATQRVRFGDQAAPTTNYMEGAISSYSGGSMSVTVDTIAGSGTIAAWNFGIIGSRGPIGATGADSTVPGPIGPSYAGTSTSSVAIGTGNKTLTTQTGLAYLPGARARAADQANPAANYMEGEVTAYNTGSGSMTIAVDLIGGAGTIAAWNINLAGDRGTAGTNGTSITFRGAYSGATAYAIGDVVTDQNSAWIALIATTGNAPPTLPTTSNTQWAAIAIKGTDGSGAVNSVNGVSGDVVLGALDVAIEALVPSRYTPAGASIEQHLAGIDGALGTAGLNPNLLINGDGQINQRGATTAADDAYHFDRWYALTQTASIGVSQLTNVASGVPSLIRLTQSNAAAQRIGSAQILESGESISRRGASVAVSGKVRCSVATTLKIAVIEWQGTADSVTSDIVSNWAGVSVAPGSLLIANTAAVAVATVAVSANTVTDFSAVGSVSSSANNLIVFVWSDSTLAQTATLDFRCKLEDGSVASSWLPKSRRQEFSDCGYYYRRMAGGAGARVANGYLTGTTTATFVMPSTYMRPGTVNAAINDMTVAAPGVLSASAISGVSNSGSSISFSLTCATGTSGAAAQARMNSGASYIEFDCEL